MKEADYYYAIRIRYRGSRFGRFLARHNASAPNLFWFHQDAVEYLKKCRAEKDDKRADIVKVFLKWNTEGKTYNEPGNLFRSAKELKRRKEVQAK